VSKFQVDIVDGDGMTPLQLAAFRSDLTMVKTLLAAGAKVNYQVPTAWMPTLGALEPQHGDPGKS
jgi:ankyrin repeat protein